MYDKLASWGRDPKMVDTTRVRAMGVGHHQRKNDAIDAEVAARAKLAESSLEETPAFLESMDVSLLGAGGRRLSSAKLRSEEKRIAAD